MIQAKRRSQFDINERELVAWCVLFKLLEISKDGDRSMRCDFYITNTKFILSQCIVRPLFSAILPLLVFDPLVIVGGGTVVSTSEILDIK